MNKIDISNWKEYVVGDLLEKIHVSNFPFRASDLPTEPDTINTLPLVAAGVDNQGRNSYGDPKYTKILSNCLTVSANGANSGATFYQKDDFSILQDAYALQLIDKYSQHRTENIYLFLAATIERALENNNWTNKATWTRTQAKKIKLPATPDGEPDWQYMDEYIAKLAAYAQKNVDLLNTLKPAKHRVNISDWKEFTVGDLFDIHSTKKKFNAKSLYFNGQYPYVARGQFLNGIRGYIDKDPQYLNPANTISFGQDTATMYYQPEPYFTGDKIQIFELHDKYPELNEKIAQFLIACMHIAFSTYSWGAQSFAVTKLRKAKIKLPVTSTGDPDFNYMEKYIDKMQNRAIQNIELLKNI